VTLADQPMSIQSIVWHTAGSGSVEFTLQSREVPPRPDWIREDLWYGGGGETISITVPVGKRVNSNPSTGVGVSGFNADGTPQYTRYTWNGTAWVNPVRVDSAGNPL
jgi:hypothetical protein